jgi:lipoate-protein ligase A
MTGNWRLIVDSAAPGAWNMAVDEALLEHTREGKSPPTLRLYDWNPDCLSLGYAQSYNDVDAPRLCERGWGLVRRLTGGRAILHANELTYSVSAQASEPQVAGSLLESYNRLAEALLHAVRYLGVPAQMKAAAASDRKTPNPVCFEAPSAYEITIDGKKLIGSAQARRRDGVLQHGSLPLSGKLERITEALVYPDDRARGEAAQRLLARAASMESVLHRVVSWDEAAAAVVRGFEEVLGIRFGRGSLSDSERQRARALQDEKYGCPEWTRRD